MLKPVSGDDDGDGQADPKGAAGADGSWLPAGDAVWSVRAESAWLCFTGFELLGILVRSGSVV